MFNEIKINPQSDIPVELTKPTKAYIVNQVN